jgi:cobaltochelatase CobN
MADAAGIGRAMRLDDYRARLAALPEGMAAAIDARWGAPEQDPSLRQGRFMIAGLRLGQVFVGIQPARSLACRGRRITRATTTPSWCRRTATSPSISGCAMCSPSTRWCTSASTATSNGCRARAWRCRETCWPDAILGPLPNVYPFIVNDPGEGAQAKRRTQAVIIDHLMPPLTRAENHGPLQDLERQVDEYYDALLVDARRARVLRAQILATVREQHLVEELALPSATAG